MQKKVHLVWMQKDLRTVDQPALHEASCEDAIVIVLVAWEPEWNGTVGIDFPKVGAFRRQFWIESVRDVSVELGKLGIPLLLGTKGILAMLQQLFELLQDRQITLFAQSFPGVEEEQLINKVKQLLQMKDMASKWFRSFTLIDPEQLPFVQDQLPNVFTEFRKMVEQDLIVHTMWAEPELRSEPVKRASNRIASLFWQNQIYGSLKLGLDSLQDSKGPTSTRFKGGQSAGLQQLHEYTKNAGGIRVYKETRNGMLRWEDTSKLSPWLALGCISARMVYYSVRNHERRNGANESTYWMFFELLWRDYFQLILEREKARLFRREGLQNLDLNWNQDETYWRAWIEGKTGVPIVDAAMRELRETGWQSNRARQIAACYLVKYLNVDWRIGATWFESQLIDFDVASNYGNWAYVAGVGNDPRGFRVFQMQKQAEMYDPNGDFVRKWLPELRQLPTGSIHQPHKLDPSLQEHYHVQIGKDYPSPLVDAPLELAKQAKMYQQVKSKSNSKMHQKERGNRNENMRADWRVEDYEEKADVKELKRRKR